MRTGIEPDIRIRQRMFGAILTRWSHPKASEAWKELAACQGDDPEAWFPRGGNEGRLWDRSKARAREAHAKTICADCPVRAECLDYAIGLDLRYGVWGGLTERERTKLTGKRPG